MQVYSAVKQGGMGDPKDNSFEACVGILMHLRALMDVF